MFLFTEEENLKQENLRGNENANLTITQDSKHICQVIAHIVYLPSSASNIFPIISEDVYAWMRLQIICGYYKFQY
jgi:hypothetical protein